MDHFFPYVYNSLQYFTASSLVLLIFGFRFHICCIDRSMAARLRKTKPSHTFTAYFTALFFTLQILSRNKNLHKDVKLLSVAPIELQHTAFIFWLSGCQCPFIKLPNIMTATTLVNVKTLRPLWHVCTVVQAVFYSLLSLVWWDKYTFIFIKPAVSRDNMTQACFFFLLQFSRPSFHLKYCTWTSSAEGEWLRYLLNLAC